VGTLTTPEAVIPALVITSVAMAVASTVCGGLLVENGQRLNASDAFVNQQWLWFNIAIVMTSLLGGYLIEVLSAQNALRAAAWIAAAAPLAVIVSLPLVSEDRARIDRAAFVGGLTALLAAFRSRDLWLIGAFLFCYYFSPGFGTPLYFQLTDTLHFSQAFIGVLSAVTAAGWIAGGLLYRYLLWLLPRRSLLNVSLVFGVISTLAYLGLSDPISAVAIYFFSGMAAMVANVATLSLAAAVCPSRAEGFTFAALMSLINLAQPLSDTIGAVLYQHVFDNHLAPLIVVSAAFTGFVLLLVPFAHGALTPRS
jgi:predicted MFS family arabinose efflux permease